MANAKERAIELNAHVETVVNNNAYHAVADIGDTEILCFDCQTSVGDIIPQVKANQILVESFMKVWNKKGWVDSDGDVMCVYGDGNQAIYKFFWDESYSFVKDSGIVTQDYKDMCAEIKRSATNANNPNGYLVKPEWMLAFKKLQQRNKEIFVDAVKARTNLRMAAANDYMTENFFGPLMLIKALWASRSKEMVAGKDADGVLFCPICGSYHVKAVGTSIPRGKVATEMDGYDRIWGFNMTQQVKEVKYFFTDEETGTQTNIIDNMEAEAWEDVEASSQENIDDYNEAVEEDIARAKFYEIAPYMGIGQACKKIGKRHSDLIADEISDYYMTKM